MITAPKKKEIPIKRKYKKRCKTCLRLKLISYGLKSSFEETMNPVLRKRGKSIAAKNKCLEKSASIFSCIMAIIEPLVPNPRRAMVIIRAERLCHWAYAKILVKLISYPRIEKDVIKTRVLIMV